MKHILGSATSLGYSYQRLCFMCMYHVVVYGAHVVGSGLKAILGLAQPQAGLSSGKTVFCIS